MPIIASGRFIQPEVLVRLTARAETESRQRREDARREGEREEKRMGDLLIAAQKRVNSEFTGEYLDLVKKNADPREYADSLRRYESEVNVFGVDRAAPDYKEIRKAFEAPYFAGGVDDPHILTQVKLAIHLGTVKTEAQILGYRGRGISDSSLPGLVKLLQSRKREDDISQFPQFKEGEKRIMINVGQGAFSLPGIGGMFNPGQAAKLEAAYHEYLIRGRAAFAKSGQDALAELDDIASEIIKKYGTQVKPRPVPGAAPTAAPAAPPAKPAKPLGPSRGINRYTPPPERD